MPARKAAKSASQGLAGGKKISTTAAADNTRVSKNVTNDGISSTARQVGNILMPMASRHIVKERVAAVVDEAPRKSATSTKRGARLESSPRNLNSELQTRMNRRHGIHPKKK